MAKVGGPRPNSGRKSLSEEVNSRMLSQAAIIKRFGNLQKGIEYLLDSGEPTLIKFAYEHAYGKPVDKVATTDTLGNDLKQATTEELLAKAAMLAKLV